MKNRILPALLHSGRNSIGFLIKTIGFRRINSEVNMRKYNKNQYGRNGRTDIEFKGC